MAGLFSRLVDKFRDAATPPEDEQRQGTLDLGGATPAGADTEDAPEAAEEADAAGDSRAAEPEEAVAGETIGEPDPVPDPEPVGQATASSPPESQESAIMDDVNAATKPRRRVEKPDTVLLEAVEVAHQAIADVADEKFIGAHLGAVTEEPRLVTHSFACTDPAYRGWHWIAVLARAPRSKKVTVCETALLPGEDSILAPAWVPWEERLQPGDMKAKDVLPKIDDDPHLQPGYEQALTPGADEDKDLTDDADRIARYELGLGRPRVLSPFGIRSAAERWQHSEAGPEGDYSVRSEQPCSTCGFLLPLAGGLRQEFGVCANEWSPNDGRVVSLGAGCGAHSETDIRRSHATREPALDDYDAESVEFVPGG